MPIAPPAEPVEQIHELNRLFLRSLQNRNSESLRRAALPAAAVAVLRQATVEQLDAAAQFPRALFELVLEEPAAAVAHGELPGVAARILELTISYCAWSTCRDSIYHARLFFGLDAEVIHTLRTTPLSELPKLALAHARIRCAFPEAECLWKELLMETRPEARRQLVLVALQPPLPPRRALASVAERARGDGAL
jgi:hypothetical protein